MAASEIDTIFMESGLDKFLQCNGVSCALWMKNTLLSLIEKQPEVSPDMLEAISKPVPTETPEQNIARIEVLKKKIQLFKKDVPPDPAAPPPAEGTPPEYILPVVVEGDIGDVLADFKLLERAGVGFGKQVTMRIYLAMKMLLHKNTGAHEGEKIVKVRCWGRILGTEKDYTVCEAVIEGRVPHPPLPEGEHPPSLLLPDPVGEGPADYASSTNQFVYYVCTVPGEEWVRLPDCQPKHVTAARNIKRMFTGNLNAKVSSKCPFQGKEADYLRTQIARISADCRLAPRGHLQDVTDYEGGGDLTVGLSEEGTFFGLTAEEMTQIPNKAWVHAASDILPQGRAVYHNYGWEPPADKPDAKDPKLEKNRPALQSIHMDKAPYLGAPAWCAHVCGGLAPEYACTVVRSNIWPGACTVGQGYNFVNFYVGNGQPSHGTMFAPSLAWPICPDLDRPEYARGPKANGICGDLNLEPPPKPVDPPPAT